MRRAWQPGPQGTEIAVYECDPHDPPGSVGAALDARGMRWTLRRLWAGDALVPWTRLTGAVILGGRPMAWDGARVTPWMPGLVAWTREAATRGQVAVLGICLGHQILAHALGGVVRRAERARRGIEPIRWTAPGRRDPAMAGFVAGEEALYSHRAAVVEPPPGATVLARSGDSDAEALRIGRSVGVQWHPEVDAARVQSWADVRKHAMWDDRLGRAETGVTMIEALERCPGWAPRDRPPARGKRLRTPRTTPVSAQIAQARLVFLAQAGRLRRALAPRRGAATPGHPHAYCVVGAVEQPKETPERLAYFADLVLAFAPIDTYVEQVRDGARTRTSVGPRLYALASPSGHLGMGRFLVSPPKGADPRAARAALLDAARRATLAANTTCKPELAFADLTCGLSMICSVLSAPEGAIRRILPDPPPP